MKPRHVLLLVFCVLAVIAIWSFGSWFDSAADKALNKCTAIEQALGECTQEVK